MKSVRGAILDLGSNSVKFMLAEQRGSVLTVHREKAFPTRLAKDLIKTGRLQGSAMRGTLAVLRACKKEADAFGAEKLVAIGTSALRSALNRDTFLKPAATILGAPIRVISGTMEGNLIFAGICSHPRWKKKEVLAVDIGGGSVEFVRGTNGKIIRSKSLPLGCVRIRERFFKKEPASAADLAAADAFLEKAVARETAAKKGRPFTLVGTGGTLTALGLMSFPLNNRPRVEELEGVRLTLSFINASRLQLAAMTTAQIERQTGLPPGRSDVILAGATILRAIVRQAGTKAIYMGGRGLRYGLWMREFAPVPFRNVVWRHDDAGH